MQVKSYCVIVTAMVMAVVFFEEFSQQRYPYALKFKQTRFCMNYLKVTEG